MSVDGGNVGDVEPSPTGAEPPLFGPYRVVTSLDAMASGVPVTARRYIARSTDGTATALLTVPPRELEDDPAYRARFLAEAENARLLRENSRSRWLTPVREVSDAKSGVPWYATPYVPALPLSALPAVLGGPLPQPTVRVLGAALAETLAELHEAGFAHAGIGPQTVLITPDGPRLTGFGAVRAAAADGEARSARPGLDPDSLPPEQAAGGRPRPLGDVYALGAVLMFASTGHGPGEGLSRGALGRLPDDLARLVTACLAPDPAQRPRARALLDALAPGADPAAGAPAGPLGVAGASTPVPTIVDRGGSAVHAPGAGRMATVVDVGSGRAAALLVPGWLPARVIAELAEQSSTVLAAELDPLPAPNAVAAQGRGAADRTTVGRARRGAPTDRDAVPPPPGTRPGPDEETAPAVARTPESRVSASRRSLLVGIASGTAGAALGGGGAWLATRDGDAPPVTEAERLAADHPATRRVGGAPPIPRWSRELKGAATPLHAPLIWREKVAVVVGARAVTGIDLRTGEEMWTQDTVRPSGPVRDVGTDLVLVPGREPVALDPLDGRIRWEGKELGAVGGMSFTALLAVQDHTVWFAARRGGTGGGHLVVAFDMDRRRELWRSPLLQGFTEGHLLEDVLVVAPGGSGKPREGKTAAKQFLALARGDGREAWRRTYPEVTAGRMVTTDAHHTLIAALGPTLRGFNTLRDDESWTVRAKGKTRLGHLAGFGRPVVRGGVAYVTDGGYGVHAVESATGYIRWQRTYGLPMRVTVAPGTPDTLISPGGRTLISANDVEVEAFDVEDGAPLWRFTDIGPGLDDGTVGRRHVALTDDVAVVTSGTNVYALPLE
ncbi:PQQ-binding-like beta-propeller repeat protein [Streptomyces sp. XD-27]|uniref:outer membrane protein assembly factor BamB family protein n=1 Tax=Streptomyces sp. XD-27 TaxID=3062779 RepID=UPI0026F4687F|nr:PQQ-binding-like beta-propeller repeat protein [Streptomyces sp. XD-27]WKX72919.1 PQQ-binding-like beta-propeller repeat protein [Streptomyces sp. XD-27]